MIGITLSRRFCRCGVPATEATSPQTQRTSTEIAISGNNARYDEVKFSMLPNGKTSFSNAITTLICGYGTFAVPEPSALLLAGMVCCSPRVKIRIVWLTDFRDVIVL